FLARFAWELTVVARTYYVPQTLELTHPRAVREINESQHRITAHLLALLTKNPHRYPDEVLIAIVTDDVPETDGLNALVREAFAKAIRFTTAARGENESCP